MIKKIKLEKIKDAITFADKASKVDGDVWLSNSNGLKADGKSILGIFSIASDSDLNVEYSGSDEDFDDFLLKLELQASNHMSCEQT